MTDHANPAQFSLKTSFIGRGTPEGGVRERNEGVRELWVEAPVFYPGRDVGDAGDDSQVMQVTQVTQVGGWGWGGCVTVAMATDAGGSCCLGMTSSQGSEADCKQLLAVHGGF